MDKTIIYSKIFELIFQFLVALQNIKKTKTLNYPFAAYQKKLFSIKALPTPINRIQRRKNPLNPKFVKKVIFKITN